MRHSRPLSSSFKTLLAAVVLSAVLISCATLDQRPPLVPDSFPTVSDDESRSWWYARFRLRWPEGVEPDWALDLVLAQQVIQPVLKAQREQISLWRFHRRAARDGGGHQFSFIFYAAASVASDVYAAIQGNPLLSRLTGSGYVLAFVGDDTGTAGLAGIAATSDPAWPEKLQRVWPMYIMGASATWLGLVDAEASGINPDALALDSLLEKYRRADQSVGKLWSNEGQHAFLHHLSALFGYRPLIIHQRF